MTKTLRRISLAAVAIALTVVSACHKKDPSLLKVFVRSSNNELVNSAKVIIIADVNSDPPTAAYVDTVLSNTSGFAQFDLSDYFDELGKSQTTGYFDILVKIDSRQGTEYVRARAHNTAVKTVYLQP
jgi:hypothetical protein